MKAKYFKEASKGDTILGTSDKWIILVNYPFKRLAELERTVQSIKYLDLPSHADFDIEIIKENEERHYALAKLNSVSVEFTTSQFVSEITEKKPCSTIEDRDAGIRLEKFVGEEITYLVAKKVTITQRKDEFRTELNEEITSKDKIQSREDTDVTCEILDENKTLGKLFKRFLERTKNSRYVGEISIDYTDVLKGYTINARGNTYNRKIHFDTFEPVDEKELLEASKYCVITIPRLIVGDSTKESKYEDSDELRRYLSIVDVYYNGRKREIVLKSEPPLPLSLGIRVRRHALSKYAKSLFKDLDCTVESLKENVKKVLDIAGRHRIQVKDLTDMQIFEEIFYIRTPRRKFSHFDTYFRVFAELSKFGKSVMFMVFHGRDSGYGYRYLPRYRAFRISGDRVTVENRPPISITGICMKGEFEEMYKDVFNLRRLLRWHYASKDKKIEMLKEDIIKIRELVDVEEFKKVVEKLETLALEERYPDNLVLMLYKYKQIANKEEWDSSWEKEVESAKALLAGLVKSGKDRDFTEERLGDLLRVMRVANLYTMKVRGYSPVLGVLLTGTIEDIVHRLNKFVRKLEGRILPLEDAVMVEKLAGLRKTVEWIADEFNVQRIELLVEKELPEYSPDVDISDIAVSVAEKHDMWDAYDEIAEAVEDLARIRALNTSLRCKA